jgi:hypothetical protein
MAGLARALLALGLPEPDGADDPVAALARPDLFNDFLKTRTAGSQVNVIVLDQFEELFTQSDPAQRDALFGIVAGAGPFATVRTHLIATVRADYLPTLFEQGDLYELVKRQSVELRVMERAELARAIQRPAQAENERLGGDKRWQPELVDRLVDDAAQDATYLPLLQVTLEAIWDRGRLTLDRYDTLTDALEVRAEAAFAATAEGRPRTEAARAAVLGILLDLVRVSLDDDPLHDARQSVPRSNLGRGLAERAALIDELVTARLLSARVEERQSDQVEMIDIIHEALLGRWERLRAAIQDQRERLQRRARFELLLAEWMEHDRSERYLLEGVRLEEARALAEAGDIELEGPAALEFLARSVARRERALRTAERQRLAAEEQSRIAEAQRRLAVSRELAASATVQLGADPELSLLLAIEAAQIEPTDQADEALRAALLRAHGVAVVAGGRDRVGKATFSPDGRWVLATTGQAARIYPADGGAHLVELGEHTGGVNDAVFSPDGGRVVTAGADGTARIWEAATGRCTAVLSGHQGAVNGAVFHPDGSSIATAGDDGVARLWDAATGSLRREIVVADERGRFGPPSGGERRPVRHVAFSQGDDRLLLTLSGHNAISQIARVWDAETSELLSEGRGMVALGVRSATFSPDGALVAAASYRGFSGGRCRPWRPSASRR